MNEDIRDLIERLASGVNKVDDDKLRLSVCDGNNVDVRYIFDNNSDIFEISTVIYSALIGMGFRNETIKKGFEYIIDKIDCGDVDFEDDVDNEVPDVDDGADDGNRIICSRIKTPDGTILESHHTHDYVSHIDDNGELYFLDGGNSYQRMNINKVPAQNMSVYSNSPFDVIRQYLKRGTFDAEGNRVWRPLCELSNNHLDNILTYDADRGIDSWFDAYVRKEIKYRKENNIYIDDDWWIKNKNENNNE